VELETPPPPAASNYLRAEKEKIGRLLEIV